MSILDRFKNKRERDRKPAKKDENVLAMVKEQKPAKTPSVELKQDTKRAHRVLDSYHLSEKSNALSNTGRYVFKISRTANKIEVRKAVEAVYGVRVASVNIIVMAGKQRRYGRTLGRTQDWKKAVVTLKAGEKITGLAEGV